MILARVFDVFRRHAPEEAPDLSVPWVCRILRRNRHATGMPADVLRDCWRGCAVCGAKLPQVRAESRLPVRELDVLQAHDGAREALAQARITYLPFVRSLAANEVRLTRKQSESIQK